MRRFSSMDSGCGKWKEGTVQYLWFVEIKGKGCWNKTLAHLLPALNHCRHLSPACLLLGVRSRNSLLSTMRYSLLCTMRLCVILSFAQCIILSFVQCIHVLLSPLNNAIRYSLRQQAFPATSIYSPAFPHLFLFSVSKIQVFTSVQVFTTLRVNLRIEPFSYPIGPLPQLPSL